MTTIEVDGLVKRYEGRTVVDGVGFTVDRGEIFGILGPNGAGKTTTVECIDGLRVPDGGRIRVCGIDPAAQESELRLVLGAQLQESELPAKLTVGEAMRLYSSFYAAPADWRELLERLRLTETLDTQYRRLSGGQQQRLAIALALLGAPRVAVLDELTTGLDPNARRDTWELVEGIREQGVTVLLVTHVMEEAERLCDRLAVIDSGRIVAIDSPAGLVARVDGTQRLRFRPSPPLDPAALSALPQVASVERSGEEIVVTGDGDLLLAVATVLADRRITAAGLRLEQASLEDAFVRLTGRHLDSRHDDARRIDTEEHPR
ncbi:ABC transporter ATP-binding protein [Agromyces sp. LHK192]|uniref:ABC transporter ATP-binding protein n=1 Tax=Agromyces sp. LHK192 TaxID=2498704 RepID=UPI000FD94B4D|nr:ABC transporter ATP-binding protein [Agromyces sp. LHK192]